jgi:penicillin amidase
MPGAPVIGVGFNRAVAWTFTHTEPDVVDFSAETVDDTARPTRYMVDGAWRPIERRVERYLDPAGRVVAADTVLYTHRGPMRREGRGWLSMRWTVLDPSNEVGALVGAAHAHSVAEWYEAMRDWSAPAQNMLVADRSGTIAIRSMGHFPLRASGPTGAEIADGSRSASDWTGFRALDRYPSATNPVQGFLASANQQPVDPRADTSYLGAAWADPWRAIRINTLLRADSAATPESMRRHQTDPGSARADAFVPAFLAAAASRGRLDAHDRVAEAARLLGEWDRRYTRDDKRAALFELAMAELVRRTWDELAPAGTRRVATPAGSVLARMLRDSASAWWDDARTPGVRERRDDILVASLRAALDSAERKYGPWDGPGWRWGTVQQANIGHMLGLAGFSRRGLEVQGGPSTLNPVAGRGTFGPSWRMVVELGDDVRAWGVYPGGQSGNPASRRYDDRIAKWQGGELDSLRVPSSAEALGAAHRSATLTLLPVKR